MSVGVVVARYAEDVYWLKDINAKFKIYIYNKGENIALPYISLPNVGREAHTYLYHIVNHYDCLDDHTIFIQANPFSHGATLRFFGDLDFKKSFIPFIFPAHLTCDENGYPHWDYDLVSFCKKYEIPYEIPFVFIQGAQFCVQKELILRRDKSFYQRLLGSLSDIKSDEAYALERVWQYIFTL